ncbi:MAG: thymidine kinase [Legionellales bacterium]|nr:thymidine kinase [Legionellales bacterium]|tara:strand:+ start:554 stop:1153 length:600 start_codon:yes stop_codon:yes gene_type:complete
MAKLYFYYSAMNAGKTTNLLQSDHNYRERGMTTLLFTPELDDRKAVGIIRSRIGIEQRGIIFNNHDNLFNIVQTASLAPIHCVLVDEAQFLSRYQVKQLSQIVDTLSIPVLAYGIRTDFLGHLFEGSQSLLAWADELIELKTICDCGRKATMNLRIDQRGNPIKSGKKIQIGSNESYISKCRRCFYKAFRDDTADSYSS